MNQEIKPVKLSELTIEQLKVAVYDMTGEVSNITNAIKACNDEIASRQSKPKEDLEEKPEQPKEEVKETTDKK